MPEWLDVAVRSLLFIIVLYLITKIIGKRQIAQLSFFEYVTGITIGSIAAEICVSPNIAIPNGLISTVIWGLIPLLAGYLGMKSKTVRDLIEGKSTVLIKDGKVLEENLKKEKYTIDELLALLRKKDIFKVADVEFAVLETDGNLNALLKKEHQPVTPKDLKMKMPPVKETQTVIMDGRILDDPLRTSGKTRSWLHGELDKLGVTLENVFIGQIDYYGELTVDLYDDKIQVPSPQERPLLLASLKKCQADLELYTLQTDSIPSKKMYQLNAERLSRIIKNTGEFLQ
ncbi:uncharacterized membrane protein YcaP (DUF421 family) [Oikeobacillus pervagus]|uniref:Uncharacterized membrane protein YcaP (DUF421 family) n=1 Tax=Oikeobacillus pervagus TaxID=1325931 RepID=A0AAJ1SZ65_9BACI|nr:DUF421 domain-containing protein [Oikeobacillus pervagus]MDQ0215513.1 uncharacterized membrane protein YcaP (DUF421 family) [Oikeobacillus pervagus]